MPSERKNTFQIFCAVCVLLLGLAVRLPHLGESLWYDEMTTLTQYVLAPWSQIVAAQTGQYIPNNHVLSTILLKLVYRHPELVPPREALLRLPALAAGLIVPLALMWPVRRSDPWVALAIGIVAALHPWLVDFSVEARGYSLLLMLGVVATNLLPVREETPVARGGHPAAWIARYALVMMLAIYTVPLGVALIPAHLATVLILRRRAILLYLTGACTTLILAALIYLPMLRGLISYYRHPYEATLSYRAFLDALPRCALTGISMPNSPSIYWALPVVALVMGSVLGWARASMRPMILTFGCATLLGMLLPLFSSAATEARFVPWILPWFCVSVVALFLAPAASWGRAGVIGLLILISWQVVMDITRLPQQQIREAFQLADRVVPPGRDIMVLYLAARESIALYGDVSHRLLAAPDTVSMISMEKQAIAETGHLPWVMMFYEKLAMQRDFGPPEARGLWTNLVALYDVNSISPGRLTPVVIYRPKPADETRNTKTNLLAD